MRFGIWSVSNGGTKIMYDDYDYDPCENCSMDCDAWEMQGCCLRCQALNGTDDPELLGCDDCTAPEDI